MGKIISYSKHIAENRELKERLYDSLLPSYLEGLDAVIVQDMGVLRFIRRNFPDLPIHASTQMAVTGPKGMRFLEQQGVTRVVPARELTLEELASMHRESPIEIEAFIHGGALLQHIRSVPYEQYDRRKKRKPGKMCSALPPCLSGKGAAGRI